MADVALDLESRALLVGMRRDGILSDPSRIVWEVDHPHWEDAPMAHDWRTHVPPSIRRRWEELPLVARLCVYETAELAAAREDRDSSMVTGPHA